MVSNLFSDLLFSVVALEGERGHLPSPQLVLAPPSCSQKFERYQETTGILLYKVVKTHNEDLAS